MFDFKERLVAEHSELVERMYKLREFLWGDTFNSLENKHKQLLIEQLAHMQGYESVLAYRLSLLV